MSHGSHDLLVYSNGTVKHIVTIKAELNCDINMFNYPFASDKCPVAIQSWSKEGEHWYKYNIVFYLSFRQIGCKVVLGLICLIS